MEIDYLTKTPIPDIWVFLFSYRDKINAKTQSRKENKFFPFASLRLCLGYNCSKRAVMRFFKVSTRAGLAFSGDPIS
jgi:hypothetical protein